jgi:hypothetical protein
VSRDVHRTMACTCLSAVGEPAPHQCLVSLAPAPLATDGIAASSHISVPSAAVPGGADIKAVRVTTAPGSTRHSSQAARIATLQRSHLQRLQPVTSLKA